MYAGAGGFRESNLRTAIALPVASPNVNTTGLSTSINGNGRHQSFECAVSLCYFKTPIVTRSSKCRVIVCMRGRGRRGRASSLIGRGQTTSLLPPRCWLKHVVRLSL